jgi:hypothetical protein
LGVDQLILDHMTEQLTEQLIDQLTEQLEDQPAGQQKDQPIGRLLQGLDGIEKCLSTMCLLVCVYINSKQLQN